LILRLDVVSGFLICSFPCWLRTEQHLKRDVIKPANIDYLFLLRWTASHDGMQDETKAGAKK